MKPARPSAFLLHVALLATLAVFLLPPSLARAEAAQTSTVFHVPAADVELVSLTTTTPTAAGSLQTFTLFFNNAGDAPATLNATVNVTNASNKSVAVLNDVQAIAASASLSLALLWDTTGNSPGFYAAAASAAYDNKTTNAKHANFQLVPAQAGSAGGGQGITLIVTPVPTATPLPTAFPTSEPEAETPPPEPTALATAEPRPFLPPPLDIARDASEQAALGALGLGTLAADALGQELARLPLGSTLPAAIARNAPTLAGVLTLALLVAAYALGLVGGRGKPPWARGQTPAQDAEARRALDAWEAGEKQDAYEKALWPRSGFDVGEELKKF